MLPYAHLLAAYESTKIANPNYLFSAMFLPDLPAVTEISWEDFEGVQKNKIIAKKIGDKKIGLGLISHGAVDEVTHGKDSEYMSHKSASVRWFYDRFKGWKPTSYRRRFVLHLLFEGMTELHVIRKYPWILKMYENVVKRANIRKIARLFAAATGHRTEYLHDGLDKALTLSKFSYPLSQTLAWLSPNRFKSTELVLKACIEHSRFSLNGAIKWKKNTIT